ncbi:hypothetical protein [Streptomyces globisporus]|uniref:hypothetical protein n=1 Tax=Streptomyces globisporus TaxID=1908 RepID=UPI0004CBE747|nr:hypothetical protein [Streptomyces globisporus]
MDDHGLNPDGTIAREGALDRVPTAFAPVVEAARARSPAAFGPDLAEELPRYRPTSLLARETNGDLALLLPGWRTRAAEGTDLRALGRAVGRRLVRTGFTLVMPRWGGWTSDLDRSAALFGVAYPDRADQMRLAVTAGRSPDPRPAVLHMLIEDLAPWPAAEYTTVHGEKTPR